MATIKKKYDQFDEMGSINEFQQSNRGKSKSKKAKEVLDRLLIDTNKRQIKK
jgi:hypothetical protein